MSRTALYFELSYSYELVDDNEVSWSNVSVHVVLLDIWLSVKIVSVSSNS